MGGAPPAMPPNLGNMFAPGGMFGGLGGGGAGAVDADTGMSEEEMLAEAIRRSMEPAAEGPRE